MARKLVPTQASSAKRKAVLAATFVVAALVLWFGFFGCGGPPQMGADREAFQNVDALFTAVTARNDKLLRDCERRLSDCDATGKLSAQARNYLDDVIRTARSGQWESAAQRL